MCSFDRWLRNSFASIAASRIFLELKKQVAIHRNSDGFKGQQHSHTAGSDIMVWHCISKAVLFPRWRQKHETKDSLGAERLLRFNFSTLRIFSKKRFPVFRESQSVVKRSVSINILNCSLWVNTPQWLCVCVCVCLCVSVCLLCKCLSRPRAFCRHSYRVKKTFRRLRDLLVKSPMTIIYCPPLPFMQRTPLALEAGAAKIKHKPTISGSARPAPLPLRLPRN